MKKVNSGLQSVVDFLKLPKCKRSQITLIIIIAIVLVGFLLVFFAFKSKVVLKGDEIPLDIRPIYNQLSSCIEQRAIDAIRLVGLQGGYVDLPEEYIKLDSFDVGYGLYNGKNVLLNKDQIEEEIEKYIDLTIPYCIEDEDFQGFEISQENSESSVNINENEVIVSSVIETSIKKSGKTYLIDKSLKKEIPVRLGMILDVAEKIVMKQREDKEYIDITFLTSLEFDVIFVPYNNKNLIFTITDQESKIEEVPYSFMFGAKIK